MLVDVEDCENTYIMMMLTMRWQTELQRALELASSMAIAAGVSEGKCSPFDEQCSVEANEDTQKGNLTPSTNSPSSWLRANFPIKILQRRHLLRPPLDANEFQIIIKSYALRYLVLAFIVHLPSVTRTTKITAQSPSQPLGSSPYQNFVPSHVVTRQQVK